MSDKNWKALERRIAKKLGTERTPLSGSNSKMTQSGTSQRQKGCRICPDT